MIATAAQLSGTNSQWSARCFQALIGDLQPSPGVYVRSVGNNANNVSADQLISALSAHIINLNSAHTWLMFKACLRRFGFAQNTKDGLNGDSSKWKLPDFMLARAMPLFSRANRLLYPLALLSDVYLVILAIGAVLDRNPDHVDDNDTILTLAVCSARSATPLSWLARKIYTKLRPWNYGCVRDLSVPSGFNGEVASLSVSHYYKPVYGALRWYHRAEAGGNPEVAELWKPICARLFE